MTVEAPASIRATYTLRLADDMLINAQRLAEYITRGPELEEELATANTSLDQLGVAQQLYEYAAELVDDGRSADQLAFLRAERDFMNCLLVEQPHKDFADVIVRQVFFDAWNAALWPALEASSDDRLAAIAAKAAKEARYHLRHSSAWLLRLGGGTVESAQRAQRSIDRLWRFTGEMVTDDDVDRTAATVGFGVLPSAIATDWSRTVTKLIVDAGLRIPEDGFQATGGRSGRHTEHLGHLLAEMQFMQRSYPGMQW